MKRVLLMMALALLVPAMLNAQATMGVYFDWWPGQMHADPVPFTAFDAYLYLHNANLPVTAVEYQLVFPGDPNHPGLPSWFSISVVGYPELYSIHLGDPMNGHAISYWPYLNGYSPGYNVLCYYECYVFEPCWHLGGLMTDYRIVVGPHPDSGYVRGTYYPKNDPFEIIGLTSILCPQLISTEETSWGAIKGQFK
jgi:hypothetical protein